MPTRKVVVSKRALRDLDTLADQTIDRWGKRQARSYVAAIRRDIESLSELALRFQLHEGTALELRCMRSGHHLVFYGVTDERVEIVRVLHERMDVEVQLGDSR